MEIEKAVSAVKRGDQAQFRLIIEHYEQKIFATAVRIVKNSTVAEDLVQEIFIKAYRNISKYEQTVSFNAWLYRLATNHCLDYVRKKQVITSQDEEQLTDFSYPEKVVLLREQEQQLEALLEEVDEKDKVVLIHRYIHELRYDEIAKMENIPHNEVRNRLHRAKKKLRQIDQAKGGYFSELR